MIKAVTCLVSLLLAASAIAKPEQVSFKAADGVRVFGDIYRRADSELAPVILLFHQAGGDARGEYTHIAIRLMENGYNVLAIDQRSGGDRFGGVNRTMAALDRQNYGYCETYPDLEAALRYAREAGFAGSLAVWGSSYSAALVFQLAAKHQGDINAVLGFSPASGAALDDCSLVPYIELLELPVLVLRPQHEFKIESVRTQMKEFAAHGIQTYVADPGVHGSSMLNADRVVASTEATWTVVLEFLAASLRDE
jgi:dienelactone hydrolase